MTAAPCAPCAGAAPRAGWADGGAAERRCRIGDRGACWGAATRPSPAPATHPATPSATPPAMHPAPPTAAASAVGAPYSAALPGAPPGAAPAPSVTALLLAHRDGDQAALERVFPLVYAHLRAVARAQLRRDGRARDGAHTLSTTALVHEAYFKLADAARLEARDRAHFLAVAARAMRQVLVEYARRHRAAKRGGGVAALDLDESRVAVEERADTLVALDEALGRLAGFSGRLARVVELRFFGGLSEEETAEALGVTDRTVRRDWVKARAWLHAELAAAAGA